MLRPRILMYALTFLFLIYPVNAATIYGIVYDLSLKKIDNARVEVNTTPSNSWLLKTALIHLMLQTAFIK